MSIADDLTKLTNDLTSAYASILLMGGSLPEHKNTDNLASAIETISGGGSLSYQTEYGRLWYAPFDTIPSVEIAEGCSVTVDDETFLEYLETNPIQVWGPGDKTAMFDYDLGTELWSSWSFVTPIEGMTTEDLLNQLGISVVLESGAEWVSFSIRIEYQDQGADWVNADLSQSEWQNLSDDMGGDIVAGGIAIPREFVRRFEFGTTPTAIPNNFLGSSGLVEVGEIPSNYSGTVENPFQSSALDSAIIFPSGIDRVILVPPASSYTGVIAFDPIPSGSSENYFQMTLSSNCAPLFAFGSGVKSISLSGGGSNYNSPLIFPEGLEFLSVSYMQALNTSFSLPQSLQELSMQFMYRCDNFTATVNVGNLSPDIVPGQDKSYVFSASAANKPACAQGIKIAGANRAAWLAAFPDTSISVGNPRYRHLVDAGY